MRAALAIVLSLLAHVGLLLAFVPCPVGESGSVVTASLELSRVELSFAETEDAAAAESDFTPMPAAASAPRPPTEAAPAVTPGIEVSPLTVGEVELPRPEPEKPKLAALAVPAVPAPKQARIVAPPSSKRSIRPEYPAAARRRGEHGEVTVEFSVDACGGVGEVRVVVSSGYPELDEAATRAVRSAAFNPARDENGPCASAARLTLAFQLRK